MADVDVRVYDPVSRGNDESHGPLFIYIHGGGWVKSDVDVYDLASEWADVEPCIAHYADPRPI